MREKQVEHERYLKEQEIALEMEKLKVNEQLKKEELEKSEMWRQQEAEWRARKLEKEESSVSLIKLFGDAMKNSVSRMTNDPVEIVSFFKSVENCFDTLKVPPELRAMLIRPHLNEKARALVTRLTPEVANKYESVRDAILEEYKLTPNLYLEKFNSLVKNNEETMRR